MAHPKPSEDTDKKEITGVEVKKMGKTQVWCSQRFLQTCACILPTIGLCIIFISFYVALQQKHWHKFITDAQDNYHDGGVGGAVEIGLMSDVTDAYLSYAPSDNFLDANNNRARAHDGFLVNITSDDSLDEQTYGSGAQYGYWDDDTSNDWVDASSNGQFTIENGLGPIGRDVIGCQKKLYKIVCVNDSNLFSSLCTTMNTSVNTTIHMVLLESQVFPNDILKNSWLPTDRSVHEIVIRHSNLTKIKSNAFNSPIFVNTLRMTWRDLNIDKVESGALLGLFKLKYLMVEGTIGFIEPALFQPVQTTLTHLKLKANMAMKGNRNPFGSTQMTMLEYLDLSNNFINGSLGRRMFSSTPNLKYLFIVNSQLESIKPNAFAKMGSKLLFLNLSQNLLTTLAAEAIKTIIQYAEVNLSQNYWICDCNLREISELYKTLRNQFLDPVQCAAPNNLFGLGLDAVNYELLKCKDSRTTTVQGPLEEITRPGTTKLYTNTPINDIDANDLIDSGEITSGELSHVLKMRCINEESTVPTSTSTSSSSSSSSSFSSRSAENLARSSDDTDLKFPAPEHEFDLQLIAETNFVIITVDEPADLMIIWFSEQRESHSATFNDISVDYECVRYAQPNLMVGPLVENSTYTFCLIPRYQSSISPFNCLPLHVPLKPDKNIWISQDKKQLSIGILCLIFLVSTIVGALVAYYGIKAYPDLLEGSKNVLVIKRPEQACYVTTISEMEYLENSSVKNRKPSSTNEETYPKTATDIIQQKSYVKLPPTPNTDGPDSSPTSWHTSLKNMESVTSGISSATCFEESFPENFQFPQDDYETPKVCENAYTLEQRMVPNHYGMSPTCPPPLPKRNSNTSDSPTVIINRFTRNI